VIGYLWQLLFGLTFCRELVPNIEVMAGNLEDERDGLLQVGQQR
jgi:hypothetical protein